MTPRTPRLRNDGSGPLARTGDERGAAFVEFLIAIPFLMIMVFGIVETGLGWRAVVQVHSAVRAGARVASKDGAQGSADFDTLAAISAALPSDLKDSSSGLVIVIFNAGSATGTVPAACTTPTAITNGGDAANQCNTYDYNDLSLSSSSFGNPGPPHCNGSADAKWCSLDRNTNLTLDNMDYVGVYIKTIHHNQTHTYFGDFTIQRQVVFRLEPALP